MERVGGADRLHGLDLTKFDFKNPRRCLVTIISGLSFQSLHHRTRTKRLEYVNHLNESRTAYKNSKSQPAALFVFTQRHHLHTAASKVVPLSEEGQTS